MILNHQSMTLYTCDHVYDFGEDKYMKYLILTPKGAPRDLVPSSITIVRIIQGQSSAQLLKVLVDSSGTKTCINSSKCMPKGVTASIF
jgi:hypothetical protein